MKAYEEIILKPAIILIQKAKMIAG